MNIAILLLSGGIVHRGAEHSMLMLAEDLAALGHRVTVFQCGGAPVGTPFTTVQIPLPLTPTSHKPTSLIGKILERLYLNRRGLLTLLFSLKMVNRLKPFDIIIPTDGFWEVLIAKLAKAKAAKIVTVGLAGVGWTDADTLTLRPDAFVALSTAAAGWAKSTQPNIHIETIPLQVDPAVYRQAKPALVAVKKPIILTVAALTTYKRIDLVIKAVSKIPEASLLVLGQGEEHDRLKQMGDYFLPGRFEIRTVPFEALPGVYAAADVFTLASQPQEAFGQVLVEAMAAGLPIVTTDDPIRREIVGDNGKYVDPVDTTAYAKALETSLHRGKIDYGDIISRYERRQVAAAYAKLFETIRKDKGDPGVQ